jgi:hypothetical protein
VVTVRRRQLHKSWSLPLSLVLVMHDPRGLCIPRAQDKVYSVKLTIAGNDTIAPPRPA